MREPLFGHFKMAIQQSGGLRFKLHEDPSVEGGPFGRLLISHGESVKEVAKLWLRLLRVSAVGGRPQGMGQHLEAESAVLNEGFTPLDGSAWLPQNASPTHQGQPQR